MIPRIRGSAVTVLHVRLQIQGGSKMVTAFEDYISGLTCLKYIVLGFNSLFMMTGVVMISTGMAVFSFYVYFNQFLEVSFFSPASLLFITGSVIFLIAIIGFISVVKESTLMINTFYILLCFVFLLQISIGIAAISMRDSVGNTLLTRMNDSINDYPYDRKKAEAVDFMQKNLYCCGIYGPWDWKGIITTHNDNVFEDRDILLPHSCCNTFAMNGTVCAIINRSGCLNGMKLNVFQILKVLFGTSFGLAIVQLTGMYFTHCLAKTLIHIKSQRLAQQLLFQNRMQTVYDVMGFNSNGTSRIINDKPPSYDEVTQKQR